MKLIIWTAPTGELWYGRPFYNDPVRLRTPKYQGLKLPKIPVGQTSITEGSITVTLGGATDNGTSIYADTDEQRRARFLEKQIANPNIPIDDATTYHLVEHTEVPADHRCGRACEFRNAWEWKDGSTVVNMPKARGIHMDRIRLVRNAELVKEDINMLKAIEAGDASAQSTVATKKQVLRDLPATFDLTTDAGTPELLKGKWPSELPDRE